MKKNISINISGIIFHIEEDGYDTLKKYLDSIHKYFSSFEDSGEIMADIESRIAEILLSKLNEGKQVITLEDINALIATMGSVKDFQAAEEREIPREEFSHSAGDQGSYSSGRSYSYPPPKHLYRDMRRKLLGGVCAGLASYFNVDPVWIRLLFILLIGLTTGVFLIVYLVLWIAVPGSYELEEPQISKKMFRDPEKKVLGGVAAGVAAYFGTDVAIIRILFVISLFLGFIGFFIYVALWITLPEANTITERIQMEGEPVTLSNIESTIKKNLNEKETEEESTLTKIILFPFRLLALILKSLAKVVGPLADVVRVALGIFIMFCGLGLFLAVIIAAGAVFGLITLPSWWMTYEEMSVPIEAFTNLVPAWTAVPVFLVFMIPAIVIILLGTSVMAQKLTFNAVVGWSLFIVFFVSAILVAIGIPRIVYTFKEKGEHRQEQLFDLKGSTPVFTVNETGMDDYDGVSLTLIGHEGKEIRLEKIFKAQGSTRLKAIENAKDIEYHVIAKDSVITFDSNIRFGPETVFTGQQLKMLLYIPYGYPFVMTDSFSDFIRHYVDEEYSHGHTWILTRDGLECQSCPDETTSSSIAETTTPTSALEDFNEVNLNGGRFAVVIRNDAAFSVNLSGPEKEKQNYSVHQSGETLIIEYDGIEKFDWDNWDVDELKELARIEEVQIEITMPELEKVEAIGSGTIQFERFKTTDFELDIHGLLKVNGTIEADYLDVQLSSKAEATLKGETSHLNADIKYASLLNAYELKAKDAEVEATAASNARVFVTGTLQLNENFASDVDVKGNPRIVRTD